MHLGCLNFIQQKGNQQKNMAKTWQKHGKNMAKTWQKHGKNMAKGQRKRFEACLV